MQERGNDARLGPHCAGLPASIASFPARVMEIRFKRMGMTVQIYRLSGRAL
jgi:hypothetical protein